MNTPATNHREILRSIEDAAVTALLAPGDLTAAQADAIREACRHPYTRDPMIHRILIAHPSQTGRAMRRLTEVAADPHHDDDADVLTVAALFIWAIGDDNDQAYILLARAELAAGDHNTLGELVQAAINFGLPRESWLAVIGNIPLDVVRASCI